MRLPGIGEVFKDRNLAIIALVFMSVQFVAFEGLAVSIPKVLFMSIMPLIWLIKFPISTRALLGFVYLLITIIMCEINGGITSMSTFIYSALFIFTFVVYYNLVWIRECFSLDYFKNLIKWMIFGYTICLLLQQVCIIVGIRYFSLFNLVGWAYYSVNHLNALAIEPSHAARLMTVFFYAFLKCTEYINKAPMSIRNLYSQYKLVLLAFIYFMVFIGSGTAIVGLAIISLYFVKKEYAIFFVFMAGILYVISPYIDYEPYNRAIATFNATLTGDTEFVTRTDNSAAARVNIIIDTLTKTDLTDFDTWIGHGMNAEREYSISFAIYGYGMISYLSKIIFFAICCFTSILSLETLMFIILFGMNIGNIAYGWATLMIFTTLKYFKKSLETEE